MQQLCLPGEIANRELRANAPRRVDDLVRLRCTRTVRHANAGIAIRSIDLSHELGIDAKLSDLDDRTSPVQSRSRKHVAKLIARGAFEETRSPCGRVSFFSWSNDASSSWRLLQNCPQCKPAIRSSRRYQYLGRCRPRPARVAMRNVVGYVGLLLPTQRS